MSVRVSHSSLNVYATCGQKYKLQYIDRLYPKQKSSALYFGSALDLSFNEVLNNFGKLLPEELYNLALQQFNSSWSLQEDKYFGKTELKRNENILYSKKDFDVDLLTEENLEELYAEMSAYKATLKPEEQQDFSFDKFLDFFYWMKEQDFDNLNSQEKVIFNYTHWLCLKNKAPYLIKAYVEELLPHIEEVVSVQTDLSTEDDRGNKLTGIADFVCKIKAGTYGNTVLETAELVIPDNKSSGTLYEDDSVRTSSQLAKYKVILNEQGHKISKGAFFVVVKDLKKTKNKECQSCGHKSTGSHKTCDNTVETPMTGPGTGKPVRCGGDWTTTVSFAAVTQIVVDEIPQEFAQVVMENVEEVVNAIEAKVFPKNLSACNNQYGRKCEFIDYCFKKCSKKLIKAEKKSE